MKKIDNTIILRIPKPPKIDMRAYDRGLRNARENLMAMRLRHGMPDVRKMGKKQFEQELKLLNELCGTKYFPASLKDRKLQFDCEARTRVLKEARDKLLALHRRKGKPDPFDMNATDFRREHELFDALAGTVFITPALQGRAQDIFRENSSRAAREMSSQF